MCYANQSLQFSGAFGFVAYINKLVTSFFGNGQEIRKPFRRTQCLFTTMVAYISMQGIWTKFDGLFKKEKK